MRIQVYNRLFLYSIIVITDDLSVSALLFGNDTNPAHPKHIGSIDPACNVADVVNGELRLHLFFSVI